MSRLFASGDQNIGASALASILQVNIRGWSPLRLTGLISLLSKGLSGVFSSTIVQRHQFFGILPSLQSSSHSHAWPLGRPQPWQYGPLSGLYGHDGSNWACTHRSPWSQFLGSSGLPHLPAENTLWELPWPLQRQVHARGSCFLSDPLLRNRHPTPLPLGIIPQNVSKVSRRIPEGLRLSCPQWQPTH